MSLDQFHATLAAQIDKQCEVVDTVDGTHIYAVDVDEVVCVLAPILDPMYKALETVLHQPLNGQERSAVLRAALNTARGDS